MPSQPLLPPLLWNYLALPSHGTLDLVTGTLGASPNWLLLRLIAATLQGRENNLNPSALSISATAEVRVILVNWLQGAAFWKDAGRRLGIRSQNITIIDALDSSLGLRGESQDPTAIPAVENAILGAIDASPTSTHSDSTTSAAAMATTVLILDGLDFLLAAATTSIPVQHLLDLIFSLRAHPSVNNVIITACADVPLMQSQITPLEIAHASFVMGLVHQARMVMSVRELDTGSARDISGVLRVNKGGAGEEGRAGEVGEVEEKEVLYFVGSDGGVRVFERGG